MGASPGARRGPGRRGTPRTDRRGRTPPTRRGRRPRWPRESSAAGPTRGTRGRPRRGRGAAPPGGGRGPAARGRHVGGGRPVVRGAARAVGALLRLDGGNGEVEQRVAG